MKEESKLCLSTYITLSSGNKIPMICYGTYKVQGQEGIKAIKTALQCGYTHIDTASLYQNQTQIRKAIEQLGISRQNLFIASKVFTHQQGYKQSRQAIERILQRLNCQYLDLALVHWPGSKKYPPEDPKNQQLRLQTWKTFIQLQQEKKVKDIGVSNFLKHHLEHLFKNSQVRPTLNQIQIHPLLWEGPTIQFCRENNIAIEAYCPLARHHQKLFNNQQIIQLSKKYNKSIGQLCLRWSLQHGFIMMSKSQTPSRIRQNIEIFDFQISQQDMELMNRLKSNNIRVSWDPNTIIY